MAKGKGTFKIEVKNAEKLAVKFEKMELLTAAEVANATRKRSYEIEKMAKNRVAYDTGHLFRSIRTRLENAGLTGVVGSNVHYAIYVEKGTRYMPARPYLFPAFMVHRAKYIQDLSKILERVTD